MSNQPQVFRPAVKNAQKPGGRVPVTRPVGRPQEAPTQSFEREEMKGPTASYSEPAAPPRMAMPPNMGFEEELEEENGRKNKNNLFKYIALGLVGTIIIVAIIFLVMKFTGEDATPTVDGSVVTNGQETNILGGGAATLNTDGTETVSFDGNPIPVKWPADVTPTRMEIQLDPKTGAPVLMLVGDKSGLGTVIRSYSSTGALSGYWVIVPDADENTDKTAVTEETKVTETEEASKEDTEE